MADNKTPEALLQEQLLKSQEDVKELQRKLTAETTDHNNTKQELTDANKLADDFAKQHNTEVAAHTKTKQELADANTLIDDLNKQLAEKPAGPAEYIVTLGVAKNAKKYRVKLPRFNYKGTVYTREDVKSNSDLLKELVEKGVVVEQVEDAE